MDVITTDTVLDASVDESKTANLATASGTPTILPKITIRSDGERKADR